MAGRLLVPGWSRALDSDGFPISARISFFLTETDALASVYADEDLSTPLTNPVQSNSAGRFPAIWAAEDVSYDWSVEAPYGPPGTPFTGTGLTTALASEVLAADAAEAAADAAEASAVQAEAAETAADAVLAEILEVIADAPEAPSVVNKANVAGDNVASLGQAATFRTNIGAAGSVALAAGTGGALVGFQNGGTGAVARTVTARLQDQPVSVLDYYSVSDGSDYGPALGRALAASPRVFWPQKAGGYAINTNVTPTITQPVSIDWNFQPITFNAIVNLQCPIIADVGLTLSANAARYGNTIQISSVANILPGDLIHVQSSAAPFTGYPDTKQDLVAIRSISGTTLTLAEGLNYAWTTSETLTITIFRPYLVTLLNSNHYNPQVEGETTPMYCVRVTGGAMAVRGGTQSGSATFVPATNFYRTGTQAYHCFGVTIDGVDSTNLSYPFGVYGGTRRVLETNTRSRFCRHGIADMGQSASGYRGSGHQGSDNFITLSAHPSFDVNVENLTAERDQFLPAPRCVGGSIRNVRISHTDNNVDTTQIQNIPPSGGFSDLYDRADFTISGLQLVNPTRSALDLKVVYGRNVSVGGGTSCYDVELGSTVTSPSIIKPLTLTGGKTGPASTGLKAVTQIADASLLDAYLDAGVYHINPRRSSVLQSNRSLCARGQVFRKLVPGTYTVAIHTNAFSGLTTATYLVGRLKLKGFVQHESTGFFSAVVKEYAFGVTDSSVVFPTTSNPTSTATTGSGGTDMDLVVSAPAFSNAGAGGDSFVQISVAVTTGVGVSNPSFGLTYELDLTETFVA